MKTARIGFALAAILIAAQAGIAGDETPRNQPRVLQAVADSPLTPMSLSAIFAAAEVDQSAAVPAVRGVVFGVPSVEVLVARIENGKLVTTCVSSESAARRFLEPRNREVTDVVKGQ